MEAEPRVCVIGAGCSGLTSIKNLIQAGVKHIVCYEQNGRVGGNWIFTGDPSHSSVCETTHLISSKKMSEFRDFPMPDDYPDYPSHRQVLAYFESYADHFGLLPYIRFNTRVSHIEKNEDDTWKITLSDGSTEQFDFLMIASGHHSEPRHPEFREDFAGEYLHSHEYKTNEAFRHRKVLVVGAGNSGCDCAVEISRVAQKVDISIRTPQYIIPKFFMGKPTDAYAAGVRLLPVGIRNFLHRIMLRIIVGDYRDYGLQKPGHQPTAAHPTMNTELLYKIRHGKVHPKVGIASIEGQTVTFQDGSSESYDTLLAATGYKIFTPFFDPEFLDYSESERIPLYLRMFHPRHKTLMFIGLLQPQGAIWPGSDLQAMLAANYVMGRWQMPADLERLAEKEADEIGCKFLKSKRHSLEVEFHPFIAEIEKQIPRNAPREWHGVREIV